jgi:hypothetical protein
MLPDARLIYLLRNPIERIWSDIAMVIRKRHPRSLDDLREEELMKLARDGSCFRHSDYARTLDLYGRYFPPGQMFIGYFEQLVREPAALLARIYAFLGLPDPERYVPASIREKWNVGKYSAMPESVARFFVRQCGEGVERIHERLNNVYTAGWVEYCRTLREL